MVAVVTKTIQDTNKPIAKDVMKDRVVTDKYWFYLFIVVYVVWLGSCGYLRCVRDSLDTVGCSSNRNDSIDSDDIIVRSFFNLARIDEHYEKSGPMVLYLNLAIYGFMLIFATFAMFFRVYYKYCGHCMIICFGIQIFAFIYRYTMRANRDSVKNIVPWDERFIMWLGPDWASFLMCASLILVVAVRKGKAVAYDTIKKTLKFYSFHANSLLFGLFMLMSMSSLICFTLGMIKGIGTKDITMALPITILVGSSYLLLLMYYSTVSVISLATADNFWTQNGKGVSFNDIVRAVIIIYRYHFGTICFNATGILPVIVAIFALLKSVCQRIRSRGSFSNKYNMVAFFFFVGEYSTMITAMSGRNFYNATDRFIHLPIEARRVARNLRQNQMMWMIIGLIMISTNNLTLIVKWMLDEDDPYFTQVAIFSYATIIYLYMPVVLIVDAVMDTILLCDVEKNETTNNVVVEVSVETTINVTVTN